MEQAHVKRSATATATAASDASSSASALLAAPRIEAGVQPPASVADAPAAPRDFLGPDEVLSLPPPPSHPDMDDDTAMPRSRSASSNAPSSSSAAARASSAAFSLAAAAKSRLALGSRMMLAPLVHTGSSSGSSRTASSDKLAAAAPSQVSGTAPTATAAATSPPVSTSSGSGSGPLSVSSISHGIASLPGSAAASLGSLLFASPGSTAPSSTAGATPDSTGADAAAIAAAAEAAAAADAELRQVAMQQRMQLLEDLVQSRRADWSYLKAMHEGSNYWLNVALLREQQVLAHVGESQSIRRSVQFFYLGLGLGRLLSELQHAQGLAMDGCQLLEELEFYFSSATVQGMKLMVATSSTLHEPVAARDGDDAETRYALHEPFRPTLYKWNQRPVFRRLTTPPIPFSLDYREVLLSLCDILAIVYSKFVEDNSSSENVHLFQTILRFDERIKKLVIDPVKKEFSAVALHVLAEEIASVRKLHGSGSDPSAAASASTVTSPSSAAPAPLAGPVPTSPPLPTSAPEPATSST